MREIGSLRHSLEDLELDPMEFVPDPTASLESWAVGQQMTEMGASVCGCSCCISCCCCCCS
jgi:hypothetical protein